MEALTPAALYVLMIARIPAVLRRGHDAVFYAALLAGTAALLTVPAAYVAADTLLGGHNWANLAQHVLMVTGVWFIRNGIIDAITPATGQQPHRHRTLPMALTNVIQAFAFVAIGTGATTTDFQGAYNGTTAGAVYYSMVMVYSGWVCTEIGLASARYLPDMRGAFRAGFILVALGGFTGAVSSMAMIADILATAVPSLALSTIHDTPLQLLFDLIPTALIGTGLTIPAVAGQIKRARTRRWERDCITRLTPVMDRMLARAGTGRTLQSDPAGKAAEQLHRLIVQIWDAELLAGPGAGLTAADRAYLLEVESALNGYEPRRRDLAAAR